MNKKRRPDTGRNPSAKEIREVERIAQLAPEYQRHHPRAVAADPQQLSHINTYGSLPDYYIDQTFTCRECGKTEIWRAADQKWYYEEAKGHIDARAIRCHACRKRRQTQSTDKTGST